MNASGPSLVVISSLFPSAQEPLAGTFIRERMFRVARELPVTVVSPQPWFPLQGLIRLWRPGYRPKRAPRETMDSIDVVRPRFFAVPAFLRRFDGLFMALGTARCLRELRQAGRADIIDAHFGFPDGVAASHLGRWLGLPFTVTLRGTEPRHAADAALRPRIRRALREAARVFSVSGSLRETALGLGVPAERTRVVANGVDLEKFVPLDRGEARRQLGLPQDANVLVTVGGLVERKGFHRVIDCLPRLISEFPRLHYLIVGGPSPEGDWTARLKHQVETLALGRNVHFLGPRRPDDLSLPLSAADVFVLSTRNEGWANVLLEAMACGLPVVTTRVGGNAEVVAREDLGLLVPFDDADALRDAIATALKTRWDAAAIRAYAAENQWDRRVAELVEEFRGLGRLGAAPAATGQAVVEG